MSREIQSKREALSLFMLIFLQIMFGTITHYLSQTHPLTNKQKLIIKISNRKSKYAEAYLWPKANEYKELRSVKKYPENEQRLLFTTHFFSPIHIHAIKSCSRNVFSRNDQKYTRIAKKKQQQMYVVHPFVFMFCFNFEPLLNQILGWLHIYYLK